MLETVAPWAGLLGLVGMAGLLGIRNPVAKGRDGAAIRLLGLFGIAGLVGIWIPGAGAVGAAGALSLWNHQTPRLAFLGKLGWLSLIGIPFLYMWGLA